LFVALITRSWHRTSSSAFGGIAAVLGSCGARVLLTHNRHHLRIRGGRTRVAASTKAGGLAAQIPLRARAEMFSLLDAKRATAPPSLCARSRQPCLCPASS
jgi:hypothetical protein